MKARPALRVSVKSQRLVLHSQRPAVKPQANRGGHQTKTPDPPEAAQQHEGVCTFHRSLGNGSPSAVWMVRFRVEVHTLTGMVAPSVVCIHPSSQPLYQCDTAETGPSSWRLSAAARLLRSQSACLDSCPRTRSAPAHTCLCDLAPLGRSHRRAGPEGCSCSCCQVTCAKLPHAQPDTHEAMLAVAQLAVRMALRWEDEDRM